MAAFQAGFCWRTSYHKAPGLTYTRGAGSYSFSLDTCPILSLCFRAVSYLGICIGAGRRINQKLPVTTQQTSLGERRRGGPEEVGDGVGAWGLLGDFVLWCFSLVAL